MRKLTLAFAVVMITGAFETQSVGKKPAVELITVGTVTNEMDSITMKIGKLNKVKSKLNQGNEK